MRTTFLKRLLWALNLLLVICVGYLVWWSTRSEAASPPPKIDIEPGDMARSPDLRLPERAPLSVAELRALFSRNFAEPRLGDSGRGGAEARLADLTPVEAPVPRAESGRSAAPSFPPTAASKPARPPLESVIAVVAIFHDPAPGSSGVVIVRRAVGRQELYWHGQALEDLEATVVKIEEDAAHFRYDGAVVKLVLPDEAKKRAALELAGPGRTGRPSSVSSPSWTIDREHYYRAPRRDVAQAMQKPLEALRGIRYTLAEDEGGGILGFRLSGIEPSSIFARYGLQNSDVVRAVNGKEIDRDFNPLSAMAELMTSSLVQLKVRRKNVDLVLSFEIEK